MHAALPSVGVVTLGLLVESLGTFIETHVVDKMHSDPALVKSRWYEYLKIAWVREPVGQRYLRRVLNAFKFELNMMVAVITTIPGTSTLGYYSVLPEHAMWWIIVISALVVFYMAFATQQDADLLHRRRGDLIVAARAQSALPSPLLHERPSHLPVHLFDRAVVLRRRRQAR